MKRILLFGALAAVLILTGRMIYVAMASDETRIGWVLEDEAKWFNSTAALSTLGHFAMDYRDETTGVGRQGLRAGVIWTFQNKRDELRRFLCRVELPEQAGEIAVDGDSASAEFPLRLYEGLDDDETMVWELQVKAELERVDGDWLILRSTHETRRGELRTR